MASLRPTSWTSSSSNTQTGNDDFGKNRSMPSSSLPSSPSRSTSTAATATPHLANENPLPRELWYDPSQLKPIQDQYKLKLIQNAKVSAPLANGWTLYPHQRKAVIRALQMRRMVLALDMGLGKTLIGCVWAKAFEETYGRDLDQTGDHYESDFDTDDDDSHVEISRKSSMKKGGSSLPLPSTFKIIVVCPVTLMVEWKRTAKDRVGLKIEGDDNINDLEDDNRGKRKKIKKKKATSTTSSLTSDKTGSIRIHSWAKVPDMVEKSIQKYVVICDEAHSMQSMTSSRTKDVLTLVSDKRYDVLCPIQLVSQFLSTLV
jgi:SNF2 family DNA or RNA helicase